MKKNELDIENVLGRIIGITFHKVMLRLTSNLKSCEFDISFEEMLVLINTWHKPGISQQWFTHMIGKDKTKITRVIDALEKKKYVMRVEDKTDRRQKLIYLTSSGKKVIPKCIEVIKLTNDEATLGIDPEHLEVCKTVLKKMQSNLKL